MGIPYRFDPLGTLGGGLPPGYKRVVSVYFDGNTYVDTGFKGRTPIWFECQFQTNVIHNDNIMLGWGGDPYRIGIGISSSSLASNRVYFGRGKTFPEGISRHEAATNKTRVECKLTVDDSYFAINEGLLAPTPDGSEGFNRRAVISTDFPLYLGAAYYPNIGADLYYTGNIFYLKFKGENGNTLAEFIPVYNSLTDEYLLWETVTKTPVRATGGQIKGGE